MIFIECYGKNVYIDDELAGYISPDGDFFARGHKFGSLSSEGDIYLQGEYVGYIEDNYDIIINGEPGGYVNEKNDLVFSSQALMKNKWQKKRETINSRFLLHVINDGSVLF